MSQNILIIGGVALGPKAACRCKRLMPDATVTLVDENFFISYGGCGIPYYMSGEVNTLDSLRSTTYHTVRDAKFFKDLKGVDVKIQTRALSINRQDKTVLVQNVITGEQETLKYDQLVLGTGASPRIPNIPGKDLDSIYAVTKLEAAQCIRKDCETGKINEAVIVGGGFIGLEIAVSLADMWGVNCTLVEMQDQLLAGALSATMSKMTLNELESHDVHVYLGEKVTSIEGEDGRVTKVITDKRTLNAQVVIFAAGFIPNSSLAKDAGLELSDFGGIKVNEFMQTSDPSIYAGGDCVAVMNAITKKYSYLPLGSIANRQGRVIGTNLAGGRAKFKSVVGTWAVKLFDLSFCGTGLTVEQAKRHGFDALGVGIEQLDKAHFYPEKVIMSLELVVEKGTRRVLGMQGACLLGDALKSRIDAVAALLQYTEPTIEDISNLEIAYSPPFSSAMDVVNAVANVADNVLAGTCTTIGADDFMQKWQDNASDSVFFIDSRPAAAGKAVQADFAKWHSIPFEEIAARIDEIPRDCPVVLTCNTGLRSYESQLILKKNGFTNTLNTMGGMQSALKMGFKFDE